MIKWVTGCDDGVAQWPCMIGSPMSTESEGASEIAWIDLGRPYPGSYKQEILANRGQKVRSRSTGAIQLGRANRAGPLIMTL